MNRALVSLVFVALIAPAAGAAAPTGAELLEVCEAALASNFRGLRGRMCTWYVTPCDCDTPPGVQRVCLTEPIEPDKLAFTVTEMMKVLPELQQKSAEAAVGEILSEIYPCEPSSAGAPATGNANPR